MASLLGTDSMMPAASITETEAALMVAPEAAVEEERRLAEEREKKEETERNKPHEHLSAELEAKKFQTLEVLLNKSEMYSTFMAEQLEAAEAEAAAQPVAAAKPTKKGGKRARDGAVKDNRTETQKLLPMLTVEMRDYQLKGVKWLYSLYQNGVNGILADQMGLGKTIQSIGLLCKLRQQGTYGPFMVVGPLSTLPNWINEFGRFCPDFPALMYHGTRQEREELRRTRLKLPAVERSTGTRPIPPDFPVIVTSYEILIADSKHLQKYTMKYIIVDEGHRLKNFNCKLVKELKMIPAENKLLLSGTPLQNNLEELWSLLNFIMPTVFSDVEEFQELFNFNIVGNDGSAEILEAERRNCTVSKLHSILKPFMLRRLKSDVSINLPQKAEVLLYAHMSKTQKELNTQVLDGTLREGMRKFADLEGSAKASSQLGSLNNMLMQMRKICNHPDLVTGPFSSDAMLPSAEELVRQCGKMELMERLLKKLHAKGHKVLIFSQMTKMLDLIHTYLDQTGHRACRIDGAIPWQERQQNINDFNSDPNTWLFLLSTRAGGLGINLTAADTVIIYDSDWNPHQDLQAMDRCHRLGQTKPVLILRLATANSVEGKMLKRAADKMALERLVIKKGAFKEVGESRSSSAGASMSAEDLVDLLKSDVCLDDKPQSGVVSDKQMDVILDRNYLVSGAACPYGTLGVGYEVIQRGVTNESLLENIAEEEPASQQEPDQQEAAEVAC